MKPTELVGKTYIVGYHITYLVGGLYDSTQKVQGDTNRSGTPGNSADSGGFSDGKQNEPERRDPRADLRGNQSERSQSMKMIIARCSSTRRAQNDDANRNSNGQDVLQYH